MNGLIAVKDRYSHQAHLCARNVCGSAQNNLFRMMQQVVLGAFACFAVAATPVGRHLLNQAVKITRDPIGSLERATGMPSGVFWSIAATLISTYLQMNRISGGGPDLYDPLRDMIRRAKAETNPPLCRVDKLKELEEILGLKDTPNVLIVGLPGTGKTAIVEALAYELSQKDIPPGLLALSNAKFVRVAMSDFTGGAGIIGQREARVKTFLSDAVAHGNAVVFIDEAHTMMGGGVNGSCDDLVNSLKPSLSSGELRCILCTTTEESKHILADPAFTRRFSVVNFEEPTEAELKEIVTNKQRGYEVHHHCTYSKEILAEAVRLSQSGGLPGHNPANVCKLLDMAGSLAHLQGEEEVSSERLKAACERIKGATLNLTRPNAAVCVGP